jgi:hypothetical protein
MPKFVPKPTGKPSERSEKKSFSNNNKVDTFNESKNGKKFIEEVDVLDYRGRRNPKMYDDAAQKLEIYVTKNYGWNGFIFMNLKEYEIPALPAPNLNDFIKANDPVGFNKLEYQEMIKVRLKKVATYNENKPKVYAIIWGQCTNSMQHKIREDKEFATYDIEKDPLKLWGRVQEILLTGAGQFQNATKLKLEAKRDFDRLRQYKNESVGDFYQRYIVEQQALEASEIDLPPDDEQAIDFINKLDVIRFASLLSDLENATLAGRDEYPKNLNEAMTRAINYKVVISRFNGMENTAVVYTTTADKNIAKVSTQQQNNSKKRKSSKNSNNKPNNTTTNNNNTNNNSDSSNAAPKVSNKANNKTNNKKPKDKSNITCYFCKMKGHYKNECPSLIRKKQQ